MEREGVSENRLAGEKGDRYENHANLCCSLRLELVGTDVPNPYVKRTRSASHECSTTGSGHDHTHTQHTT